MNEHYLSVDVVADDVSSAPARHAFEQSMLRKLPKDAVIRNAAWEFDSFEATYGLHNVMSPNRFAKYSIVYTIPEATEEQVVVAPDSSETPFSDMFDKISEEVARLRAENEELRLKNEMLESDLVKHYDEAVRRYVLETQGWRQIATDFAECGNSSYYHINKDQYFDAQNRYWYHMKNTFSTGIWENKKIMTHSGME